MNPAAPGEISLQAFEYFRSFLSEAAGISLSAGKRTMVAARLGNRLRYFGLPSYDAYFELLNGKNYPEERQVVLDLLTTNETYFFREPNHFDFLRDQILPRHRRGCSFRVWSAASSSGEEAYSIAMLLADRLGRSPWETVGSDISSRVLEQARRGHYRMDRIDGIPKTYLRQYCLKGMGPQQGTLLIKRKLRERARFLPINLTRPLPDIGYFDVIFLRNLLIYFDQKMKRRVVANVLSLLKPGGHLFVGHSETLKGINKTLEPVVPAMYRRPV